MLIRGILNPHVLELLARVRHTNTLVIADRGFPSWPQVPTVDLSLVDDIPTVQQVLAALLPNWKCAGAWMAREFLSHNAPGVIESLHGLFSPAALTVTFEPHVEFKRRVPAAIGLIRTAGTAPYSNIILESA